MLEKLLIGAAKVYQHLVLEVIPKTHPADLPDASTCETPGRPLGGWEGVEDVNHGANESAADES